MTSFNYTRCKYSEIVDKIFSYKYLNIALIVCAILTTICVIFEALSLNPLIPSIPIMIFMVIIWIKFSANRIEYFRAKKYCKNNNITLEEFNRLIIEKYPNITK